MLRVLSAYRNFLLIILTIAVAIPCNIKRDWKKNIGIEINQNSPQNPKTTCTAFCSLNGITEQKKIQKFGNQLLKFRLAQRNFTKQSKILTVSNFHLFFKEKIPTHLRNCQFLI